MNSVELGISHLLMATIIYGRIGIALVPNLVYNNEGYSSFLR